MSQPSDSTLVERACSGEQQAAMLLCERYFGGLYDFIARTALSNEEAAKLTQNAFAAAFAGLSGLPDGAQVRTWLFGIARDIALDHAREDGAAELETFATIDPASLHGATDIGLARELAPATWRAAAALDARQRSLLDLNLRHGFTPTEVAAVLGVSGENGEVALNRIKLAAEEQFAAEALTSEAGCSELAAWLNGDGTAETRHLVGEHLAECQPCSLRRQAFAPLDIFGALAPVAPGEGERAAVLGALRSQWAAIAASLAAEPPGDGIAGRLRRPGGWTSGAMLRGLGGLVMAAGMLLLAFYLPASPIALTGNDGPRQAVSAGIQGTLPPDTVVVLPYTPSSTPTVRARTVTQEPQPPATATPARRTQEPLIAVGATPTPTATPSDTPTPAATATLTATATPPGTPTPIPCTPGLSPNVSQVNASAGSSSFELYNSFCRALDFEVSSAASWVSFDPPTGHLQPGSHLTISVTAEVSQLPEGTTTGMAQVMWPNGAVPVAVQVTREGQPPVIGEITSTCSPTGASASFSADVADDFAVKVVTAYYKRPDGSDGASLLKLADGGNYEGTASGPISTFIVVAIDHAGHSTQAAGVCG